MISSFAARTIVGIVQIGDASCREAVLCRCQSMVERAGELLWICVVAQQCRQSCYWACSSRWDIAVMSWTWTCPSRRDRVDAIPLILAPGPRRYQWRKRASWRSHVMRSCLPSRSRLFASSPAKAVEHRIPLLKAPHGDKLILIAQLGSMSVRIWAKTMASLVDNDSVLAARSTEVAISHDDRRGWICTWHFAVDIACCTVLKPRLIVFPWPRITLAFSSASLSSILR